MKGIYTQKGRANTMYEDAAAISHMWCHIAIVTHAAEPVTIRTNRTPLFPAILQKYMPLVREAGSTSTKLVYSELLWIVYTGVEVDGDKKSTATFFSPSTSTRVWTEL